MTLGGKEAVLTLSMREAKGCGPEKGVRRQGCWGDHMTTDRAMFQVEVSGTCTPSTTEVFWDPA